MDKVTAETIAALAGKPSLSNEELISLAEARRATEPAEEQVVLSGWIVTLAHHVHTHGQWYARARSVDGERGTRGLAGPCRTREDAMARAMAWTTRNAR